LRAFLSHSSKDKYFVSQVASVLGPTQIEYDEQTFEFVLSVQAIRKAIARSELFVAFVSQNSLSSKFVEEEHRAALEARGRGELDKIIILTIDGTSYKALPSWLRNSVV
jgi:TIR domain